MGFGRKFRNYLRKKPWAIWSVPQLVLDASLAAFRKAFEVLVPPPQLPGLPQERGDERSPTYAWDGMRTGSGQGLTIPVVLGRHGVAGHIIYSDVRVEQSSGAPVEYLRVILFLSEGPIYRIGNQLARIVDGLGGFAGQTPGGTIPAGIRVNSNLLDATQSLPGARLWMRAGTLSQPPFPTDPFRGATSTLAVGEQLDDAGSEFTFTVTSDDSISAVGFAFAAPGGVFQQDSSGNQTAYPVSISLAWRPEGQGSWRSFYDNATTPVTGRTFASTPSLGAFAETFTASLQPFGAAVRGPIEVRATRTTPAGSATSVRSSLTWRSASISIEQQFAYPGAALLAIELQAGSRFSGGSPEFLVPVDGVLVRVWDEAHGFSQPCWDVPSAPWNFNANPPGRNPAWLLGEFLTNKRWGLGTYLTDANVDWPALRRWAAFCDAEPNPGDPWHEASFTCDLVLDSQASAWEIVQRICSCGRATPIWIDGKLSVVYRYRDAHSDGGLTVPAKAVTQLITAGNCEDVRVRWLSRGDRPTAFQYQFLNADKLWAQDILTEEDQEAPAIEDPTDPNADAWRPESVQAWGVTRVSQLQREAAFAHRANRLVRREITFAAGPDTLSATVGELFDFQHELLRPFGADVPKAAQVLAGGTSVTEITVDHVLSGAGLAFSGRSPSGAPVYRTVTTAIATTVRGRPATRLQFASAATIVAGATVAIGLADKLTQTYEILAITLADDVRRRVRAIQHVPEIYDPLPALVGALEAPALVLDQVLPAEEPPALIAEDGGSLVVEALGGAHRISWERPAGFGAARARVYAREAGASAWSMLEETSRTWIETRTLTPWRTYEIAVAIEGTDGGFPAPEASTTITVTAEEFPPFGPLAPTNLRAIAAADENAIVLRWDSVDSRDLEHYEVRAGADWAAAVPVYRGRLAEARLSPIPAIPTLQVAARSRSGLYGPRAILTHAIVGLPFAGAAVVDSVGYVPTGSGVGTHSGTAVDSTTEPAAPFVALTAASLVGTFTSDEVNLGVEAAHFLRLAVDLEEHDGATVGDLTFAAGSGEARWRTVRARPASAGAPGIDWSSLVSDLTATIEDLPDDLRAGGTRGEVGSHVQAAIESRIYAGGAWGSWQEHADRLAICERWQARATLRRASTARALRIRTFLMETSL